MGYARKSAVVCLAAGRWQVPVIRKAQELGYAVIAVDRNASAPGFGYSDERIDLSTWEAGPIIKRLAKLLDRYNLLGVLNRSSGLPVITAAEITAWCGLPGVPPASARQIVDKSSLFAACKPAGINAPNFTSVDIQTNLDSIEVTIPCVIKPSFSLVGKSGVTVISDRALLDTAVRKALNASSNGRANIEAYVPGFDVSLLALVKGRRLAPLVLLDELNRNNPDGSISGAGFAVPSRFVGQEEEQEIISLGAAIVDHFGLETTLFAMSCRCGEGAHPSLIEIHLDMGGDLVLDQLLPASTNFDFLAHYIRGLTGEGLAERTISFKPTALIFGHGNGLVSEREPTILHAQKRSDLEPLIAKACEEIHA